MNAEVEAAGGVVLDDDGRVALVHRPRYDDWSLPKGKLDAGESFEEAALREVEEETGMRCRLLDELDPVEYRDNKGRQKLVRYWRMAVDEDPGFIAERRGRRSALGPARGGGRAAELFTRRGAGARTLRFRVLSAAQAAAIAGRRPAQGAAASSWADSDSSIASSAGRPASCTPTGRPSSPW